ncbi:MAG TPA: TIGR03088 family PEP-CTERM/XrtA system glycosyltransferase [Rhodocyclaceae bacterium]|nr:TIGR03088 family PEP-CTERM/XrtA system glycosyltransferase [Rhodocyclaceae bacterium]
MSKPCHIVHLVYRFAAGGLENVLVQLINGLPHAEFRHTIIALTEADASFMQRIERNDVEIISLHKKPGQPFALYPAMYRLLRRLQPDVMHSCNLAALEFMPVAALAGVPRRIHAEHGWDVSDPDGSNRKYRLLRRLYKHFVHEFIVVSAQLQHYLAQVIGVPAAHLHFIENGVDTERFRPRRVDEALPEAYPFGPKDWVIGSVGRLEPIKNQQLLVEAFIRLKQLRPQDKSLRLVMVGAGPLAASLMAQIEAAGLSKDCWLPGARGDIPQILRQLSCFVLPSLAEGTSCTLQEALATELPIVATEVGGNAAVLEGSAGVLVPSADVNAMAAALLGMREHPPLALHLAQQRSTTTARYGLRSVLQRYQALFKGGA